MCQISYRVAHLLLYESIMTIRILLEQDGSTSVLHVIGWLEGEEAEELLRVTHRARPTSVLDLSELRAADARGIDALRVLAEEGIAFEGVQPIVALALEKSRT
jgi:anti-anti-sigma regulatory factor